MEFVIFKFVFADTSLWQGIHHSGTGYILTDTS
uniref:Uncharacterized protein n=1 Tax=Solanum lycopersicum TaxID=4081 RepID=K4B9Z8_SOLLC